MKDARGHGSNSRGGGNQTVREQIAMRQSIDERHFPTRSTGEKVGALDQGIPTSGTQRVINEAQSASRFGAGAHAGGVHAIKGKLYGATLFGGGSGCGGNGCGTIYQVTTKGKEQVLYRFQNSGDGAYPRTVAVTAPPGSGGPATVNVPLLLPV